MIWLKFGYINVIITTNQNITKIQRHIDVRMKFVPTGFAPQITARLIWWKNYPFLKVFA